MLETIVQVNQIVNNVVWGVPMIVLLAGTGLLMTVLTGGFQFRHLGHWMRQTIGGIFLDRRVTRHTGKGDGAISQFQSMCTALAATIGTGNIVGVASALAAGGPGAVFWMWVVALLGMMTSFSENVLGIYYRKRDENGAWLGGTMYYLRHGVGELPGCKWLGNVLATLFSLFCLVATFGIGNMSQVNSIAINMEQAFGIRPVVCGVVLMVVVGIVVLGGIKRVASVAEKLVPVMALGYVGGALIVCAVNYARILPALAAIFKGAFGLRAVGGGIVGSGVKLALNWGMKRGIFSNEAGLGSAVMVNANSNVREPVRQGMWGIFEVFADTIVVCTLTALTVLTSGLVDLDTGALLVQSQGSALVGQAFATVFGAGGPILIALAIFLFAFSTLLCWSHYGATAFAYLFGTRAVNLYKLVFVAFIAIGATMDLSLAWDLSDTFNGLMALPNLVGLVLLSPVVVRITRNYIARNLQGQDIEPMLSADPDIQAEQAHDLAHH